MQATVVALNGRRQWVRIAGGVLTLLAVAVVFAVTAAVAPSAGKRAGAIVFAAVFAVACGLLAFGSRYALRRRALVVDVDGVGYQSSAQPWRLTWPEVSSVAVQIAWHPVRQSGVLSERVLRNRVVRLVIEAQGKPEQPPPAVYRGRWGAGPDGWGIPLGPVGEIVAPLDAGLRAHGGAAYTGVVDLGRQGRGLL